MGKNGNGNSHTGDKSHLHRCLSQKKCSDRALTLLSAEHVDLFQLKMDELITEGERPASAKDLAVLHVKSVLETEVQPEA